MIKFLCTIIDYLDEIGKLNSLIDCLAPFSITLIISSQICVLMFEMPGMRWQDLTELLGCFKPTNLNQKYRIKNGVLVVLTHCT